MRTAAAFSKACQAVYIFSDTHTPWEKPVEKVAGGFLKLAAVLM
jgi:hypothetical protein